MKEKRRTVYSVFIMLACMVLMATTIAMADSETGDYVFYETGSCGNDLTWVVQADTDVSKKTLTISGTGAMTDYTSASEAPWSHWYSDIETINIGEDVTRIGNYAFSGNKCKKIDLPAYLDFIGNYAFFESADLNEINFTGRPVSIGKYAFAKCTQLHEVVIPDTPDRHAATYHFNVQSYAFRDCTSLESISLPQTNSFGMEEGVFYNCSSLKTLTLLPGRAPAYLCYGCTSLTSFEMNEIEGVISSLPSIGTKAFANCDSLKEFKIPILYDIEAGAFSGCNAITDVWFEGDKLDWNQLGLSTNEIGGNPQIHYTFSNVGDQMSGSCGNNLTWKITEDESEDVLTISGIGAMPSFPARGLETNRGGSYTNLELPWDMMFDTIDRVVIEEGVTTISSAVFSSMPALKSVSLPETVTSIGVTAFRRCPSLKYVDIKEGLKTIENSAFWGCPSLQRVDLPEGLISISREAFRYCTALTQVTIPESVSKIDAYAFSGCSSLLKISLPESLTELGAGVFQMCSLLEEVNIPESMAVIPAYTFYSCSSLNKLTLPDSVTEIGPEAFYNCGLKELRILGTITAAGSKAFYNCSVETIYVMCKDKTTQSYLEGNRSTNYLGTSCKFKSIHSSENAVITNAPTCTTAGTMKYVCPYCGNQFSEIVPALGHSFTDYRIHPERDSIGAICDNGCGEYDLTEEMSITSSGTCENGLEWKIFSNGNLYIYGATDVPNYTPESPAPWRGLDFTECVVEKGVYGIGDYAFEGCTLKRIILPPYFDYFGVKALANCPNLEEIKLDPLTEPYSVNDGILYDWSQSELIVCPAGKSGTIRLPETVTRIEYGAFDGCSLITDIELPASLTSVKSDLWSDCTSLQSIYVDENNENYTSSDEILYNKSMTELVMVPQGRSSDVTIGKDVTRINDNAFANCKKVKNIIIDEGSTGITFGQGAFNGTSENLSVTIPYSASRNLYSDGSMASNVTIRGYEKSGAEFFARENNLKFVSIGSYPVEWSDWDNHRYAALRLLRLKILNEYDGTFTYSMVSGKETDISVSGDDLVFTFVYPTAAISQVMDFTMKSDGTVNNFNYSYIYHSEPRACAYAEAAADLEQFNTNSDYTYNLDFVTTRKGAYYAFTDSETETKANKMLYDMLLNVESGMLTKLDARLSDIGFWNYGNPKEIHNLRTEDAKEPTCSEAGYSARTYCIDCGAVKEGGEVIPPTGRHTWEDVPAAEDEARVEPTCTDLGAKTRKCSVCGETEIVDVPELGHDYQDSVVEPTCTQSGYAVHECSRCGDTYREDFEALGHNYVETVIEPACTLGGYTLHECTRCGDSYKDSETDSKGHMFDDWVEIESSTCETTGLLQRSCIVCGYTESENLDPTGHEWEDVYAIDISPTCTVNGSKSIHCKKCDAVYNSEVIPATGIHTFDDWETVKEPTCTEAGSRKKVCTICGETETEAITALGHTWNKDYTIDLAPTEAAVGSKSIHCSVCDAIKEGSSVSIDKLAPAPTPGPTPAPAPEPASTTTEEIAEGTPVALPVGTVTVISADGQTVAFTKALNKKSVTVPDTVSINGQQYSVTEINANAFTGKKIRTVTIGKNVKNIKKNAFKGSAVTKLIVKTKKLKKATVKGSLKGSKVKTIQVKVGKKADNKKYVKTYKKIFTKSNAGKKVSVK